ncbi:MAG: hypothetical protein JXA16_04115 [Bacteroidales bacterium]|nr:hypothetical protein [Bacteroidales bacterium]
MAQENRISIHISEEDIAAVKSAIQVLQDKLMPHLVTLSVDERHSLTKMGDKNFAFVSKCKDYMEQNPGLAPQYIDLEEMKVDMAAVETLRSIQNTVAQINSSIDDSMMLSGSEAYVAALSFYHNVKGATRMNVAGAKNIYDDLKKQFIRKTKSNPE